MKKKSGELTLTQKYNQMIDAGVLPQPVAKAGHFSYPSRLISVPSISSNNTNTSSVNAGFGEIFAKLERGS